METTEKHTARWLLIASIICIGLAVLIYLPLLVPAVVVIIWLKFRGPLAMLPYFIYLGITYLIGQVFSLVLSSFGISADNFAVFFIILFVCLTFPPTIVSVLSHRSGRRMYECVLQTILASFFGVGAFVAVVYIYTEQSLTTLMINALTQMINSDSALLDNSYAQAMAISNIISGTTAAASTATEAQKIAFMTDAFTQTLPTILGSLVVSFGLLTGFFSYYLPYLFLKNKDIKLTPCPAFKDLRIPKPEWIILIVVYLAASVVTMTNAASLQIVALILRSAISMVFTIQGLAFLVFLFKSKRISTFFFVGLIVIGFLFDVLFWLGLLESVLNMRLRIKLAENGGGEGFGE